MFNHGHPHSELLLAIEEVGGVACQDFPDLFFPEDIPDEEVRQKAIETAESICERCPIVTLCGEYAVNTGQEYGIWGGLNAQDIRVLRQYRREQS